MAHVIAHKPDRSQDCFGSVSVTGQLFDPRFQFEQGVSLSVVSSVQILQPRPIKLSFQCGARSVLQGISHQFSKINDQFSEYQIEYQTDTKRCIPIDRDTRSSQTKPQINLNKKGQKRPIPTLASNSNCVCRNGLGGAGVQPDTKTDTIFQIRGKPA